MQNQNFKKSGTRWLMQKKQKNNKKNNNDDSKKTTTLETNGLVDYAVYGGCGDWEDWELCTYPQTGISSP